MLRASVIGIAEACIVDPDDRLVKLLTKVITETREILRPQATSVSAVPVLQLH
jgi:hypothetical protein